MTVGLETKILLQPPAVNSTSSRNNINTNSAVNQILRNKMPLNTKRCLFGPPNPDETKKMLAKVEEEQRLQFIGRYGMDPLTERQADYEIFQKSMRYKNLTNPEKIALDTYNSGKILRIKERIGKEYFKEFVEDNENTNEKLDDKIKTTINLEKNLSPKDKNLINKTNRHNPYDKNRDSTNKKGNLFFLL